MKKKLIFRILGALASALIIASVFVPFVSVTGYTTSLWETFELTESLYLPIMIIVFGAIGVIFFALNIKTEFAYMSTGAITFFIVIETIDIINQGVFDTLSIGYYFLVAGALLTGIMAFLCNLKFKEKVEKVVPAQQAEEHSMLDQIDKLYNDQTTTQNEISPIQPIDNVVEPLPIQPVQTMESVTPVQPIQVEPTPIPEPVIEPQPMPEVTPVMQEQPVQEVIQPVEPVINEIIEPQQVEVQPQQVINPVVQEFAQPVNPVVEEFSAPNPVVQEFAQPVNPQPIVQEQPIIEPQFTPLTETNNNPVVQEFTNPGSSVVTQPTENELDIFGQPINK